MKTAAYARYSSESQRAASIDDQARNCREHCARNGWPDPVVYSDAAISGARADRPGYRRMLAAAAAADFDVLLIDDLSRLSRDSVEAQQCVRRLRFAGVRVIAISDGIDTDDRGHKIGVGLRGLMGELYLDDLRDKTHRGQRGRALAGASAGGLPYGYRVTTTGQRAIDVEQAEVVRRIFADYAAGLSPRAIAHALNRERVPAPRGGTWAVSAINPDVRRGIGILANPLYIGRMTWNRSRWVKHPDTGRRLRQERPRDEWITTEHPELAILTQAQWTAAQARLPRAERRSGRPPSALLSGLLRCGGCGGPLVIVDAHKYGCARAKDRGTCPAPVRLDRRAAETAMLAGVREQLLSDTAFRRFQRAVTERMRATTPDTAALTRALADAQRERDNILRAIRAGIITPSVKAELEAVEAALDAAQRARDTAATHRPATILPRARERWQALVRDIEDKTRGNARARAALAAIIGTAIVKTENGDLVAEIAASQTMMVAGAGSVHCLQGPIRIQIPPRRSRAS